ncbi:hypothetical protein LG314_11380 [Agrococcus terreus]|uniref:hypothetical protein n=1 Tax=Agrococcus terreus TaxID=574649 RepID=UPI00384FDCEE
MVDPARAAGGGRLSSLTALALVLSGLGLLASFASGLGLPLAFAGTVCGAIGLVDRREDRPWPLVAVLAGALGTVVGLVLLILAVAAFLEPLRAA